MRGEPLAGIGNGEQELAGVCAVRPAHMEAHRAAGRGAHGIRKQEGKQGREAGLVATVAAAQMRGHIPRKPQPLALRLGKHRREDRLYDLPQVEIAFRSLGKSGRRRRIQRLFRKLPGKGHHAVGTGHDIHMARIHSGPVQGLIEAAGLVEQFLDSPLDGFAQGFELMVLRGLFRLFRPAPFQPFPDLTGRRRRDEAEQAEHRAEKDARPPEGGFHAARQAGQCDERPAAHEEAGHGEGQTALYAPQKEHGRGQEAEYRRQGPQHEQARHPCELGDEGQKRRADT